MSFSFSEVAHDLASRTDQIVCIAVSYVLDPAMFAVVV